MFQNLPTFESISIDQILDIRKELSRPLINFRSSISEMTEKIESVPESNEFKYEVNSLYRKHILEQIIDIEESIMQNRYLMKFIHNILKEPINTTTLFASDFGLAISRIIALSSISEIANAGSSYLISQLGKSYIEYKDTNKETEIGCFFIIKLKIIKVNVRELV